MMNIEPVIEKVQVPKKTLCLSMIVKNEIAILKRLFDSVYQWIDYWVICDTGSTDGTQDFIKWYFREKGIQGELLEHEWKNFGHNRNQLLKASKGKADYLLLMDADFIFKLGNDPNFKEKMDSDAYHVKYEGDLDYRQLLCVKSSLNWIYKGVTHEYIICENRKLDISKADYFTFIHECDGNNRSDKIGRDIRLLEQGLIDEPTNARYHFYLAQSYLEQRNLEKAREHYQKRIDAGGWKEEIYYSKYQIGITYILEEQKNESLDNTSKILDALTDAYNFRPQRLEALHYALKYCMVKKMYNLAFRLGISAVNVEYPKDDVLFISRKVHIFDFLNDLAICAFFSKKYMECAQINQKMLNENRVPQDAIANITNNVNVALEKARNHELTDDPHVKDRIEHIKTKFDSTQFDNLIINSHLMNQTQEFDHGIILNLQDPTNDGWDVFKLVETIESLNQFIDTAKAKKESMVFVIMDSNQNKELTDVINNYFNNFDHAIFRGILKQGTDGKQLGIDVLKRMECKNEKYIDYNSHII